MSSLLVQPASAMPPPYVWDAVPDFKANPSLNPGPDQYGNLGVWSYVTTPGSSGAGTPLPTYAANAVPGVIAAWYQVNPGYNLPTVAINYSASTYFNGVSANIPNNVVLMHPYAKKAAVLRWKSPVKARVCIKVTAEDLDPGSGDGVRVYVRKGNGGPLLWTTTIPNGGGVQTFSTGPFAVGIGAIINLTVDAGAANDFQFDSTGVTEVIFSC